MTRLNLQQKNLVEKNIALVEKVIFKHFNISNGNLAPYYRLDDAIQDGYVSLCKAASMYSENKNYTFEMYASVAIKNHILNCIRNIENDTRLDDSLDANIKDTEDISLLDTLESDVAYTQFESYELSEIIKQRKSILDVNYPHAYDVFLLKYISGYDINHIAIKYDIDTQKAYYLCSVAKKDLAKALSSN